MMTQHQITAANADEQTKQLYQTTFPENEQILTKNYINNCTTLIQWLSTSQTASTVSDRRQSSISCYYLH